MWEVQALATAEYQSLRWLEGCTVKAERVPFIEYKPDGRVTFVKDYPNAVLLDLEFVKTHGWSEREPRHYKILVSKASLLNGDVVIKYNGQRIDRGMLL